MPTMDGQEKALLEFMEKKQWKQAFNICEKKLRKAPANDYLVITKIQILVEWSDQSRLQQGLKELQSLLEKKPPVADFEALLALDKLLDLSAPQSHLTSTQKQTWQRAAASRPQDERFHTLWYRSKFDQGDFNGAQLACMTWMKNFPKERKPFFLYILTTHLISEETSNEQEKTVSQSLAYKFLSNAAKDVPKVNGVVTGRQINSFEDACLLFRVYRAQGRYAEAIKIIADERILISSHEPRNRWELTREYMELLELNRSWAILRHMCHSILGQVRDPNHDIPNLNFGKVGDDWKTWQMFIRANNNDNPTQNSPGTEEMIKSFCNPSTESNERNAQLALLLFYSTEVFEGRQSQSVLLQAIMRFFRNFSTKIACFLDLKPYLLYLDAGAQKQLLSYSSKIAFDSRPQPSEPESSMIFWITREINVLKLEYHLVISRDRNIQQVDLLTSFISNCLRLYQESLNFGFRLPVSDRRPGDDAALLAAMGLIRLFKAGEGHALLQSIIVLEHALTQSKHNYDALLILVRLYMFLGAGSLALERYTRLSIKNLQHATVSWVLYTRLSTTHPHPPRYHVGGRNQTSIDPAETLSHASTWYRSAGAYSLKAMHTMQDSSQWNMVLDSLSTTRAIFTSMVKLLIYVESKRIERLRSPSVAASRVKCDVPECTKDTRDTSAFPNFESGQLTFEEHLPSAGTSIEPDEYWIHNELCLAQFWELLHKTDGNGLKVEGLDAMRARCLKNSNSLTRAENATADVVQALHDIYKLYASRDRYDKEWATNCIKDFFNRLDSWIIESTKVLESSLANKTYGSIQLASNVRAPMWSLFHECFSHLEQCVFIIQTLEYVLLENKKQLYVDHPWLSRKVKTTHTECDKMSRCVWRLATSVRDELRDQAFLWRLDDAVIGNNLDNMEDGDLVAQELRKLGEDSLKKVSRDLKDSWIDGLEGIIQSKIK